MPELPEAEITKRKLAPLIKKTIVSFSCDWPRGLRVVRSTRDINRDIRGRRVRGIRRHGKVIFLDLGERIIAFHQRMSGRLEIPPRSTKPTKHVHHILTFSDGSALWFHDPRKFGVVWYGKPEEVKKEPYHRTLGSDGLAITLSDFKARLREHRGMIKPLLLRQDVVAGIGNITADETLWEARIHPKRHVHTLKDADLNRLFRAMKNVLDLGIRAEGSTLRDWAHPDGESGKFQEYLKVYGRGGEKCPRSPTPIKRMVVGGRGTWICSKCQRL
ncbi:MAG: bifunctional DNA-formamidopyrimidine glycosylase/DNA-(apurinic or apyrimidinic site) lyase [Candidatus Liptonbacteria bacterium]|nr:bifunctional DNA-formamidopyrimidine glycosylase/DNA-(apurinic or apyrimidinic site) lyase [Candidatus Liptonbacteria bacterium]